MQTAFDVIKDTYDYETCKEIVDHGCQSGVCSQHIYYADTIKFFEQYPDEITRELVDNFGTDYLKEVFNNNDANLDCYMNDLVWTFIELVAMRVVDEFESTTQEELSDSDNYMKEEISNYGYTKSDLEYVMFGTNPPRSMTDTRYAQV